MRNAGRPMSTATAAPTSTPIVTASPHGKWWRPRTPSPTSFTVVSPPTAANPNCPSDTCPAHPVRMVSEHPAMAKISTRVHRNDSDARVKNTGINTSAPNSATTPMRPRWRDHHGALASGARTSVAAVTFHPPSSAARVRRENASTTTRVATNNHSSVTPRSLGSTFCWRITSTMPTPIPATSATGRLRIRAISATTNARKSSW